MHVLVTGGLGFIGSHYVDHLYETTDAEILILDKVTYAGTNRPNDGRERVTLLKGDICDFDIINRTVSRADSIVHFAAESHVDRSIDAGPLFAETNVVGTTAMLEAAKNADLQSFVQVSTDEVYGPINDGEFSERDRLNPRNPYSASKAGADHLALAYHETHGLPTVRVRPTNCYGPRQHEEKLIPKTITNALAGDPIPVYGDGEQIREWTYVTDCVRGIETARQQGTPGGVYNIGSAVRKPNLGVVQEILDLTGGSYDLIDFVDDRPGHDARYAVDSTRVRDLGWQPTVDFETGLERTVDAYRQRVEA